MKVISLQQPFASSIALGYKHYITRASYTDYRGKIAIYASPEIPDSNIFGKLMVAYGFGQSDVYFMPHNGTVAIANCDKWTQKMSYVDLPLSVIVAVADLTDCVPITNTLTRSLNGTEYTLGRYQEGWFAYKLENVQRVDNLRFCMEAEVGEVDAALEKEIAGKIV